MICEFEIPVSLFCMKIMFIFAYCVNVIKLFVVGIIYGYLIFKAQFDFLGNLSNSDIHSPLFICVISDLLYNQIFLLQYTLDHLTVHNL